MTERRDANKNILEEVQSSAEDYPFDTIFIPFAQSLPHSLFFGGLARDADPGTSTIGTWRVFLDLTKLNTFGGYVVACVGKIKHAPEGGVWVRLRDLKEGKIRRVRGRERELVNRGNDTRVGDGPFEVARGLAADYARGGGGMAWVREGAFIVVAAGREQLCDAEIALGRGCQQVVFRVLETG